MPPSDFEHYKITKIFHERIDKNIPPDSIFFLGDSLIQGLYVGAISCNAINFGIGGDTTQGLSMRIHRLQSLNNAKTIVIHIGFNDLKHLSNTQVIQNLSQIIGTFTHKPHIILSGIFLTGGTDIQNEINLRIRVINEGIKQLCHKYTWVTYDDTWTYLVDENGNLAFEYHIGDGIHLNKLGNAVWIDHLQSLTTQHTRNKEYTNAD